MKTLKFYLLVVILSGQYILAQQQCGNSTPENPVLPSQLYKSTLSWSIPVIFHVIKASDGSGDVFDSQLINQINALNTGFAEGTDFNFYLAGIRRITNDNWRNLNMGSQQEIDMKNTLAIDPITALNIYITSIPGTIKAWSTYPWDYDANQNPSLFGIVIRTNILPSGDDPDNNLGRVTTHEVGHYLGLYHTFDDFFICKDADGVSDTPIHIVNSGCPSPNPDTCPQPGLDPIHNYMNYTNDPCRDQFTDGQNYRMNQMVQQYKPRLGGSIINISNDVTINSGSSLQLFGNVTVNFSSGKKIIINGTFNSNNVLFTSVTTWGGIYFASGSSGNLNGCTINNVQTYASGAVKINNSSPTIQNCTIGNNGSLTYGLYIMNNAAPILTGNTISNNDFDAVVFDHAGGYLTNNSITASSGRASINCWDNSNPAFSTSGGSRGYNLLQGGSYGIYVDEYCTVNAGTSSSQASYNKLMNQSARHIFATGYSTVYARYNYFERYNYPSDPNIGADIGSTVICDQNLYSPPFSIENPGKLKEQMFLSNTVASTNDNNDLLTAINLKSNKQYNEAISIYKQILNKDVSEYLSSTALVELGHIYYETKDKVLFNYIKSFTNNKTIKGLAIDIVVKILLYESQLEEAKTLNDELLSSSFKKTRFAMKGKLNLFHYYYKQGNYSFAKDILSELKANEEWNIGINTAELLMNEIDPQSIGFVKQSNNDEQNKIVQEFSLDQNYPNPFNPATKITFTIQQTGHIKIKIYDLLGREIANLADGIYEAGKHEITFDASKLPSGVYFYNLTTESNSISKKMLLIK
jgi:tetratricopeptide (TPR) repeat protein